MSEVSSKLSKRRDELAELASPFEIEQHVWKLGYNACHAEMLPMLEQMAEALHPHKHSSDCKIINHYGRCSCKKERERAALAAYQAWRGEDDNG